MTNFDALVAFPGYVSTVEYIAVRGQRRASLNRQRGSHEFEYHTERLGAEFGCTVLCRRGENMAFGRWLAGDLIGGLTRRVSGRMVKFGQILAIDIGVFIAASGEVDQVDPVARGGRAFHGFGDGMGRSARLPAPGSGPR